MACYYIFKFHDSDAGHQLAFDLSGSPNGTAFNSCCPIYINSKKDVWIHFPSSNDSDFISDSLDYIRNTGGAEVIQTDIIEKIVVPSDVTTRDNSDPQAKKFNTEMINMFSEYAPHLCFD